MGRYDPYWIIILFFIYLDPFRVEKIGGINFQGHFSGRSQFGKLGYGTFWAILRHQTTCIGVKNFPSHLLTCDIISHIETFPMMKTSSQLEFI
jgi:hypothetical protein